MHLGHAEHPGTQKEFMHSAQSISEAKGLSTAQREQRRKDLLERYVCPRPPGYSVPCKGMSSDKEEKSLQDCKQCHDEAQFCL